MIENRSSSYRHFRLATHFQKYYTTDGTYWRMLNRVYHSCNAAIFYIRLQRGGGETIATEALAINRTLWHVDCTEGCRHAKLSLFFISDSLVSWKRLFQRKKSLKTNQKKLKNKENSKNISHSKCRVIFWIKLSITRALLCKYLVIYLRHLKIYRSINFLILAGQN